MLSKQTGTLCLKIFKAIRKNIRHSGTDTIGIAADPSTRQTIEAFCWPYDGKSSGGNSSSSRRERVITARYAIFAKINGQIARPCLTHFAAR
jgi:hypothetical protein